MGKIRLQLGKYYQLITKDNNVYRFKLVGGEPIKGELENGDRIDVYSLMDNGFLSIDEIENLRG